jgi:hypothetical protein
MAPKKNPHLSQSQPTNDFENLSQVEMLKQMKEMAATMASLSNRFDKLERMWSDTKEANRQLQNALQEKDREITNIRERLNEQEQYTRSWSIRVLNMKLPQNDASDPLKVMQQVYDRLLLPILQGALTNKLLTTIPTAEQILETAHILPCKPGATPPIIARFYSRNIRAMIFRLKKDFAPRATEPSAGTRSKDLSSGKMQFLLFEDLTRPTFNKMRAISQHDSVENCWSVSGALRYKLKDDPTIYKVKSVFATVEQILASNVKK